MKTTTDVVASLRDELAAALDRHRLLDGVRRLLVGCSGGADSTALLDLLAAVAGDRGLELVVAHLHHGWRGAEADGDAEHAHRLASRYALPFHERRVRVVREGGSLEAAARAARLEFFAELVGTLQADAVALGHHADDQAETILLNLARGTGRLGLGGMSPRVDIDGLRLIRPLLGFRRERLIEFLRVRGVLWREDSSNESREFARNRARADLVPALLRVAPGAVDSLVRSASVLRDEEAWLDSIVADELARLRKDEAFPGAIALARGELAARPRALQRRLIRLAIRGIRGDLDGIESSQVEAVIDHLVGGDGRARDLPGVRVTVSDDSLRLLPLAGRRLADSSG